MKKIILLGIISILLATSCKKDEEQIANPPNEVDNPNYLPMDIDNYWVYVNYRIDSLGNETNTNRIDSIIITKDTLIDGKNYFKFDNYINKSNHFARYMRDSSGYIVDSKGNIYLSNSNFTDILRTRIEKVNDDTLFTSDYKMEHITESITVPAGTFTDIVNFQGKVITYNLHSGITNPRYQNNYYSKNTGLIREDYFYLNSNFFIEKRLKKYHIKH